MRNSTVVEVCQYHLIHSSEDTISERRLFRYNCVDAPSAEISEQHYSAQCGYEAVVSKLS